MTVVARIALEEHGGHLTLAEHLKAAPDQRPRDPLSLTGWPNTDWAQDLNRDEASWCIKQSTGEHHVPRHRSVVLRYQGHTVTTVHERSKLINEGGYDSAVVTAERLPMKLSDAGSIITMLLPDLHHTTPYNCRPASIPHWDYPQQRDLPSLGDGHLVTHGERPTLRG